MFFLYPGFFGVVLNNLTEAGGQRGVRYEVNVIHYPGLIIHFNGHACADCASVKVHPFQITICRFGDVVRVGCLH